MCIDDVDKYRKYNYFHNKEAVSKQLIEDFKEGLLLSKNYKKTIKFYTHKWFVENIIESKEIDSEFHATIKEIKPVLLASEILILINKSDLLINKDQIIKNIKKKREGYKVILKYKGESKWREK